VSKQSISKRFQIPARLDALVQLEEEVRAIMDELPDTSEIKTEQYNFTLALHELCTNVIEHAYGESPGDIRVELTVQSDPQLIRAVIVDSGEPFGRTTVNSPILEVPQEHGYGLFLIEKLVDDVAYTRLRAGNEWTLIRIIS
jgi:serine/threonine-protein kinase RsbW